MAVLALLASLALSCSGDTAAPAEDQAASKDAPAAAPAASAAVLKQMATEPNNGAIGTNFTLSAEGLPAGKEVQFFWQTWDGSYQLEVKQDKVDFYEPKYAEKRVAFGTARTDANGNVKASFTAPDDYGGAHSIFAVVEGADVARGGFQIRRSVTIEPNQGPIGTPITITMKGLDIYPFGKAMAVRYNNSYVGFISGVTTQGTATAVIRAAGPVGHATIELSGAGVNGGGFLTNHQSPYAYNYPPSGQYRLTFNVTGDVGPPANSLDWPSDDRVVTISPEQRVPTSTGLQPAAGVSAAVEPKRGPVGTPVTLKATGLTAGADTELVWLSVGGTGGGQAVLTSSELPLSTAKAADDGSLSMQFDVPNELGGWHVVQLRQGGKPLIEVPYYTERSLVSVSATRVKAGEPFDISVRGGGFYDLDNGFAVTYDNSYMGYGCGFTAKGPVTFHMVATGGPGTHLIDIYPMTYRGVGGNGKDPWPFDMPHINSVEDHPGLSLGMRLPIFRLAIEVVE